MGREFCYHGAMAALVELIRDSLTPFHPSLQPFIFFVVAILLIALSVRIIRGLLLAIITTTLILLTLYLSSALFGTPLHLS